MKVSEKGLELIKSSEGLRLKAYLCSAGVWTIGYGHTKGVKRGMVISEAQAEDLLRDDLRDVESVLNRIPVNSLLQQQFDALASFVFNFGATKFGSSTLLKRVIKRDPGAVEEFHKWVWETGPDGKKRKSDGLIRRRIREAKLFTTGELMP